MTAEHILQECPTYEEQRRKTRPTNILVSEKLHGYVHISSSEVYRSTLNVVRGRRDSM
jgi:hypothetical protein